MAFLDENGLSHFKDKYDEQVESNLNDVVASEYSDTRTSTITAGTYVMKDGNLYRAKQDIPTSETWTAAHWEQVKLANDVGDLKSALQSGSEEDAIYHLGFYLDENGDLCQVDDE